VKRRPRFARHARRQEIAHAGRIRKQKKTDGRTNFFKKICRKGVNRPRKYWSDLKKKLAKEGFNETSEKIGQLKIPA
jgi:hypothetical protein